MRITRSRLIAAITLALASIGLLAGCAAGGGSSSPAEDARVDMEQAVPDAGGAAAPDSEYQAEPNATVGPESPDADRAIIVTSDVSLRSSDVPAAVGALESLVVAHHGRIEQREERTEGGSPYASMSIRVPADQHDAFINELRGIGDEVLNVSTTASDVTLVKVDLEARIKSLESSITSLQGMLAAATNVKDMLEIERELGDRDAELQGLKAQYDVLIDQVAMSTINVSITTPYERGEVSEGPPGFLAGLGMGLEHLVNFFGGVITIFGYLLPGIVIIGLIALAIWFWAIRPRLRTRRAAAAAAGGAEPAAAPDAANEAAANEAADGDPAPSNPSFLEVEPHPAGASAMPPLPESGAVSEPPKSE